MLKDIKPKQPSDLPTDTQLSELQKEARHNLEGWQRALADYENAKKELDKRIGQGILRERENIVLELLPIYDNFQTALTHIPEANKKDGWAIGLEHIKAQISSLLSQLGVEQIAVNLRDKFDHNIHEAISSQETEEFQDDEIVEVISPGYQMNGKIIKPAKVVVNNLKQ